MQLRNGVLSRELVQSSLFCNSGFWLFPQLLLNTWAGPGACQPLFIQPPHPNGLQQTFTDWDQSSTGPAQVTPELGPQRSQGAAPLAGSGTSGGRFRKGRAQLDQRHPNAAKAGACSEGEVGSALKVPSPSCCCRDSGRAVSCSGGAQQGSTKSTSLVLLSHTEDKSSCVRRPEGNSHQVLSRTGGWGLREMQGPGRRESLEPAPAVSVPTQGALAATGSHGQQPAGKCRASHLRSKDHPAPGKSP